MLSSVLRSDRAVLVNVEIMRAFVRLRRVLITHADLARKRPYLSSTIFFVRVAPSCSTRAKYTPDETVAPASVRPLHST